MSSARVTKPYARPTRSAAPEGAWLHDRAPGTRATRQQKQPDSQPAPTASQVPTCKLSVSNLHYEVTPNDLSTIFGVIGKLASEPEIRYDRSGRSTGVATVLFLNQGEATRAKNQLDGVLAKGQPMSIKYDAHNPLTGPRGAATGSKAGSLLGRLAKPPLIDRLGAGPGAGPSAATSKAAKHRSVSAPQPQTTPASTGFGPVRTRGGRQQARAKPAPKKPKTAEELDKELESYGEQKVSGPTDAAGDVEMA
jgi:THO complex subunit 4